MYAQFYLIVGASKRKYSTRYLHVGKIEVRKRKPVLRPNEIAIRIELSLPEALFTRPTLELNIAMPSPDRALAIAPEFQKRITEAVAEAAGVPVNVRVCAPEEEL